MTRRALILGLGIALSTLFARAAHPSTPDTQSEPRTIRYTLTVRNLSGQAMHGAAVRADAPVRRTATQETLSVTASQPFELAADEFGNQTLIFHVDLAPYATRVVEVEARMAFAVDPRSERLSHPASYIAAEPLIEAGEPRIRRAALVLGGIEPADVARRIFDWVAGHVAHAGYVAEPRGALVALTTGKGDCTEHAHLFVALARARGIPARTMAGYVAGSGSVLRGAGYHNWAEFYADGVWHLADPQRGVVDAIDAPYVATRILTYDAGNAPRSPRADDIEVRMD